MDVLDRAGAVLRQASSPIAAAWAFGSVVRGEAREDSDLDVAVLLRDPRADARSCRRDLMDLAARLEQAAGRRIDLVVLGFSDPILAHRVLSEGVLIHDADRDRRIRFTAEVLARYLDWAPRYERTAAASLETNRAWARARVGSSRREGSR